MSGPVVNIWSTNATRLCLFCTDMDGFLINMVTCNHIKWRRLPTKKLFLLLLKISFHNRCLLDDTVLYLKAVVV